ncbi:MAG: phosphopantetheine-binding protein [Acidobacteriota bacterium]
MSQESTKDTVARLIREVMGDELLYEDEIAMDTSFSQDLELESIEFVALAERIQAHYGSHIDFVGWLSGMELDQIIALRVGDLVAFIDRCRS